VIGHALRVVAGRHRDHAARAFVGRERLQPVERAAFLERRGELQVLELQPDLGADDLGQRARMHERRVEHLPGDVVACGADTGEIDHGVGGCGKEEPRDCKSWPAARVARLRLSLRRARFVGLASSGSLRRARFVGLVTSARFAALASLSIIAT
jgi:hypothetical protein